MQYTDSRGDPIEGPILMKVPSKERLDTIHRVPEILPSTETKEAAPGESPGTPLKRSDSYHDSD